MFHDHRLRDDPSCVPHEVFQQDKFTGLKIDLSSRSCHFPLEQIHPKVAHLQYRGIHRAGGPPDKGLNPREQLRKGKRFGEVVIAPGLETLDAVIDLTFGAQDNHRRVLLARPKLPDEGQSVELRQHDINDHGIVGFVEGKVQAIFAIWSMVYRKPGLTETFGYERCNSVVVFDDQNTHSILLTHVMLSHSARALAEGRAVS
jgi:hypothetical protein